MFLRISTLNFFLIFKVLLHNESSEESFNIEAFGDADATKR